MTEGYSTRYQPGTQLLQGVPQLNLGFPPVQPLQPLGENATIKMDQSHLKNVASRFLENMDKCNVMQFIQDVQPPLPPEQDPEYQRQLAEEKARKEAEEARKAEEARLLKLQEEARQAEVARIAAENEARRKQKQAEFEAHLQEKVAEFKAKCTIKNVDQEQMLNNWRANVCQHVPQLGQMPALFQADKQIAAPQPIAFIGIKPLTNPFANVIKPALGGKIVSASEIEQQVVDDVLPEDEQVVEEEQIVEAEVEVEQAVEEPVEAASEEPAVVEESTAPVTEEVVKAEENKEEYTKEEWAAWEKEQQQAKSGKKKNNKRNK